MLCYAKLKVLINKTQNQIEMFPKMMLNFGEANQANSCGYYNLIKTLNNKYFKVDARLISMFNSCIKHTKQGRAVC